MRIRPGFALACQRLYVEHGCRQKVANIFKASFLPTAGRSLTAGPLAQLGAPQYLAAHTLGLCSDEGSLLIGRHRTAALLSEVQDADGPPNRRSRFVALAAVATVLVAGGTVFATGLAHNPYPTGKSDSGPNVPVDPLLYRFYEIVQVYGTTLKALIHEQFGDGIMSAIDFELDVQKKEDPKGDRVVVTMNGKFLPYKKW